jgi:DNA modification methylase
MITLINASAHDTGLDALSVHCIVTSPPYWGLRAYAGEQRIEWPAVEYSPMPGLPALSIPAMTCGLGEERHAEAYIGHLILVMREMWRVLRDDGTCWVNLGDSYAANRGYQVPDNKHVET